MNSSEQSPEALVFDLDGTLLDSTKNIPQSTLNLLKEWKGLGKKVVIATARPLEIAKYLTRDEDGNTIADYIVATNGAVAYDVKKDDVIYGQYFSQEKVKAITKLAKEFDIEIEYMKNEYEVADEMYAARRDADKVYARKDNVPFHFEKNIIDNLTGQVKNGLQVPLIAISCKTSQKEEVKTRLDAQQEEMGIQYSGPSSRGSTGNNGEGLCYFDIMPAEGITKLNTLKIVFEKMGLTMEDNAVAFGDGKNDQEMLSGALLSCVPYNAIGLLEEDPEMRNAAKVILPYTNDEAGLDNAIRFAASYKQKKLSKSRLKEQVIIDRKLGERLEKIAQMTGLMLAEKGEKIDDK